MKIVFTAPRYAPFVGGVETHTQALATRLAARGHEVVVVTTNPAGDLPSEQTLDGVVVLRVPSWPQRGDPFIARGVGSTVNRLSPDLVHVQGYQSAFTPMVLAGVTPTKVPTLLTFHGGANANPVRQALYPLQRRILAHWLRDVTKLVVLTHFERELYARELRVPSSSFVTIPNGCDLPLPRTSRNPHLIVSAGRLDPAKGHERVINAFALVHASNPSTRLRIVGGGPDRDRLVGIVRQLTLSDVVEFQTFDATQRQEFSDALNESGVVISMSRAETQPITLLEAARLGCNIGVSTASEGLQELVDEKIAWGISPNASNEELSKLIEQSLASPFSPQRDVLKTWDDVVATTEVLYGQLVENH